MNTSRTYTMTTRARSTEQTRVRILDAAVALHLERLTADIALDHIAERASVSVQTLLRHFGSRDGLVEAAFEHARHAVEVERAAPSGDITAAVHAIVEHYESRGDGVLVLLAQEHSESFVRRITEHGKALHRTWVKEVFAPFLDRPDAEETVDLLVVATDVYTWKLLRRDRGLSESSTEDRIKLLVSRVLSPTP